MLERKSFVPARPVLAGANDGAAPHQKAFNAYLRSGDDDGLRGLEMEGKALGTAVAGDGGYLVDPQTANTIKSVAERDRVDPRDRQCRGCRGDQSYDVLIDHGDVGARLGDRNRPA